MAAAVLLAGLFACGPALPPAAGPAPTAGVALVIGINDYRAEGTPVWPDLASARTDAEAVARILEQNYGFEIRRFFDADATRRAILNAIEDVCRLDRNTTVIIFYAGHGILDADGHEGYWIPFGAARKEEGIAHADLAERLLAAAPRRLLVISDACFSGALLGRRVWEASDDAGTNDGRRARYVISSGDLAPVPDAQGTHSVFAQALLEALTNPPGNELSVPDLVRAMQRRLQRLTGQVVRAGPLAPETDGPFVLRRLEK
jgi:uncharacterized caspase-like protein